MNRKEAIEELKKYVKQSISTGFGEASYYHQMFNEIIEVLESPLTLADLLGWEEGVEYDYKDLYVLKVKNNRLFMKSEKCSSGWCDFALFTDEIEELQQAKQKPNGGKLGINNTNVNFKEVTE